MQYRMVGYSADLNIFLFLFHSEYPCIAKTEALSEPLAVSGYILLREFRLPLLE